MLRNLTGEQVVKEKQSSLVATVSAMESDGMLNDVTPTVEKEKQSSLEDTTGLGSFPPLPTQVNTSAGTLSKSSYANAAVESIRAVSERFANSAYGFFLGKKVAYPVVANYVRSIDGLDAMFENCPWFIRNNPLILKKWHPEENVLKEDVGTVLVWVKLYGVPVTAFSEDGLSAIATKLGRSSYARVMIKLRADVELKDNIVMVMPKITREGHYTCNVRVEYE
ncbi:retrotransposon protein, putative, ty1-copia subclass [Tanacetum coccineum]